MVNLYTESVIWRLISLFILDLARIPKVYHVTRFNMLIINQPAGGYLILVNFD